jgi:enoyl-CoA hydratase
MRARVHQGPTSLDLERGDGWAWIGLSSGDGLNRLHADLLAALDRLCIELRWDGVQRLALSSAHWMDGRSGHFSAGADLHEVAALDAASADPFSRRGQRVMAHLLWPGWRTLTVLSGVAMGGGCDLALHGQQRWAAQGLKMAHPAARHGILTGFGGTRRLPEVLGTAGADRLFRRFEHWDAEAALGAGAVQRILAPGTEIAEIRAWLGEA